MGGRGCGADPGSGGVLGGGGGWSAAGGRGVGCVVEGVGGGHGGGRSQQWGGDEDGDDGAHEEGGGAGGPGQSRQGPGGALSVAADRGGDLPEQGQRESGPAPPDQDGQDDEHAALSGQVGPGHGFPDPRRGWHGAGEGPDLDQDQRDTDDDQDDDDTLELTVKFDGDDPDADKPDDSSVIRRMREELRTAKAEAAELRKATAPKPIEVGEKPTLASCDYDEDEFDRQRDAWDERRVQAAKQNETAQQTETVLRKSWDDAQAQYQANKAELAA